MLAAPRCRKAKLTINPQGNNWSNDNSKFGQKILEGCGWSKGEGLGVGGTGRTEHIKVKFKNDATGIGFDNVEEYVDHQDDFNSLLDALNQNHVQEGGNSSANNQVISLEKQSQKSKRRIHYSKFTRGKDLSSKSDADLKGIFGHLKSKHRKSKSREIQQPVESGEEDNGLTTITSTSTIQEYFSQKMDALKKRQSGDCSVDVTLEKVKKAKKEKHKELPQDELDMQTSNRMKDENIEESVECNETFGIDLEIKRKRKKKHKKKAKASYEMGDNAGSEEVENVEDNTDVCKKITNTSDECTADTMLDVSLEGKKKRRKVCDLQDDNDSSIACDIENIVEGEKKSKKKKKRKEKYEDVQEDVPKKKKKRQTESKELR